MSITAPPPFDVEQPAFVTVARRITREDIEGMTARRAGLAPAVPDPLDIGLWSPMRHQLALTLDAAVPAPRGDSDMSKPPASADFDPAELAPGDICIIHYGLEGRSRAEFVRRTRNPDWFIVLRWNPYERRYARNPVRMHRRTIISRGDAGEV